MSGPTGLAAWLRHAHLTGQPGGSASAPLAVPLPLDAGDAEPVIPAAVRRAVLARHTHCTFPGCPIDASACHIHHYIPRARGGPTTLGNPIHVLLVPTQGYGRAKLAVCPRALTRSRVP